MRQLAWTYVHICIQARRTYRLDYSWRFEVANPGSSRKIVLSVIRTLTRARFAHAREKLNKKNSKPRGNDDDVYYDDDTRSREAIRRKQFTPGVCVVRALNGHVFRALPHSVRPLVSQLDLGGEPKLAFRFKWWLSKPAAHGLVSGRPSPIHVPFNIHVSRTHTHTQPRASIKRARALTTNSRGQHTFAESKRAQA